MKTIVLFLLVSFSAYSQTTFLDGNKTVVIYENATPSETLISFNQYRTISGKTSTKDLLKVVSYKLSGFNGQTMVVTKSEYNNISRESKSETLYYTLDTTKPTEIVFKDVDTSIPIALIFTDNAVRLNYLGSLPKYNY